ncbi:helix-turn-helix domain-containing protein, partial [Frankia sp. Cj3]|uniref:helix-turn-helix domain-containing protein n=1 Tax=Frankia sp. Cj3 TaxID=2880976 RepID=UPI0021079C17
MGQDPAAAAFGECIRSARLVLGLSHEELADRAGLHRTYAGSAERGLRNVRGSGNRAFDQGAASGRMARKAAERA